MPFWQEIYLGNDWTYGKKFGTLENWKMDVPFKLKAVNEQRQRLIDFALATKNLKM